MAKKELKEDTEESIGESLVTPVKTSSKKKGLSKNDEALLIQVLGLDTANRVMEESLVSVTKLDKTNRFEVTVDRQERPSTLFYFDDEDIIMEGPGTVATRGPGTSFGELALMYSAPRNATCKASEPSVGVR
jgi:hypothetical protein